MFAPCATSRLTISRLFMAPDPGGVGLLLPLPGFRTHDSSCSAVHPCGAKFGSAPASSSVAASSKCGVADREHQRAGPLRERGSLRTRMAGLPGALPCGTAAR